MKGVETYGQMVIRLPGQFRETEAITVTAPNKFTAIRSGRDHAMKKAAGDIVRWDCKLKQT